MKAKRLLLSLLCVVLLFTTLAPTVYAAEPQKDEDKTYAPYFFVESEHPETESFPLKKTDVTVNINGSIAETYVTQVYTNEGANPINAKYVFPCSTKAAVHGMTMTVGNQMVRAQIQEKEEAKETFETAKSEGKSASLLTQETPNVFTMDVANIMPGDTITIELHYTELITPTEGTYQFAFPTVVGPRYVNVEKAKEEGTLPALTDTEWLSSPYLPDGNTPNAEYNIRVNLSTGVPITGLTSKSHKINIDWDDNSIAHISLADPADYAGNRDFILDYKLSGENISSGITLSTGESENFFMLNIQPPAHYEPEEIVPREYVFVLDVSGSMDGYPLDTAKELIRNLVSDLRKEDSFNLILFCNDNELLSPKSVSASPKNIDRALKLIDRQHGYGGTELNNAVQAALDLPKQENTARSIVIITDGYISGETETFDIICQNLDEATFFPFGIGTSVNRHLIEGIANAGQGESFIVTDKADADETAKYFRTYMEAPLLTDIQITYEGFDAYHVEPVTPSTLYAMKPITLFGKWKGEPSGIIHITGKCGTEDYVADIPISEKNIDNSNCALPYLWARKRVERLSDFGTFKDNAAIKEEVTRIGLTYSMATSYTSFVAVLETIRNPEGESTDVDQPNPLPLHVSNLAIGCGYTVGSEPGTLLFTVLAGCFAIISFKRKRKITQRTSL
ncbi:MAG: VWA domain-containing protein [Lachnospiraceae bacterium]|nr:VWA domain-containing protein [Lachnospiraceae bacterium]